VLGFNRGIMPSQPIPSELKSSIETIQVRDIRQAQEFLFG